MRELQRKLDHDIKLKEFFAIKGNLRVNADLEAREADRKQWQQELADKQLADLQDIMKQMQVRITVFFSLSVGFMLKFKIEFNEPMQENKNTESKCEW